MDDKIVIQKTEQELKDFLNVLIQSKKLPAHIKTTEDAFTIAQMGKELGFKTMQSFHYIIIIQGKLTLSAKAIGALLRKGGVKYITAEDAVYIYDDGTTSESYNADKRIVDRRTTIKFYRDELEEICSFYWSDAKAQGLTTKDNWQRLPRQTGHVKLGELLEIHHN